MFHIQFEVLLNAPPYRTGMNWAESRKTRVATHISPFIAKRANSTSSFFAVVFLACLTENSARKTISEALTHQRREGEELLQQLNTTMAGS